MAARESYERIAAEVTDGHEVVASQMFGMPVLKVRGKAFAGLHGEVMTFKLPAPELEKAKSLPGGGPFEPMAGRQMGGWAQVSTAGEAHWNSLTEQALAFVSSLAPARAPSKKAPAKQR